MAKKDSGIEIEMLFNEIGSDMESLKNKAEQAVDPDDLPLLLTRDVVLFPGIMFPIMVGREESLRVVKEAHEKNLKIGIVCQLSPDVEHPQVPDDVYEWGVLAHVVDVLELPDGQTNAIVHTVSKFRITGKGAGRVIAGAPSACVEMVRDTRARSTDKEFMVLVETIRSATLNILEKVPGSPTDLAHNVKEAKDPVLLINIVATRMPGDTDNKVEMLRCNRIKDRAFALLAELTRKEQMAQIMDGIRRRTQQRIDEQQRDAFLHHQMEVMREELYGSAGDEIEALRERAKKLELPDEARTHVDKELSKLARLNPNNPDYSVQYGYVDCLLSLPWGVTTPLSKDFDAAEQILNSDHYGLDKVKDRILEQLAVMMHNPGGRSPIICLVGAPGVGKTSIGRSMAAALGRNYTRVALGGMDDEAEIRGHRRTYIGAMPGRIIDAVKRSGSMNPLVLLDEVDKLGHTQRGDPASALLEVLDPEQNCRFHDNYIDLDFDLSNVMFVATANTLEGVPQPLIDRMEVIEMPGYLPEEKMEIARRHLLPRALAANAFESGAVSLTDEALRLIIEAYTSESGVRQLEKRIAAIVRKVVLALMRQGKEPAAIGPDEVKQLLGVERHSPDRYEPADVAGVATGLAWTAAGGEILFIEASLADGGAKGSEFVVTGNLGDIMKESARIALHWTRAFGATLGAPASLLEGKVMHVHVPEGAIPKDGPSAGITMATALLSALSGRKVRRGVAMTGELTLSGRVLPVGGIKEKVLAARRAGVTDIVLPEANRKDVADIKPELLNGLTFHHVSRMEQAAELALEKPEGATPD